MTQPSFPESVFLKGAVKIFTGKTRTMKGLSDFWKELHVETLPFCRFNNFKPESQIAKPSVNLTSYTPSLVEPLESAPKQPRAKKDAIWSQAGLGVLFE